MIVKRCLVLAMLVGCGRVGFDTGGLDDGGHGSTTAFGETGWSLDPGAQISGGQVAVDARGTIWTMTAPLGPELALSFSAVVIAIGTGADPHFSIELAQGTVAFACEVARQGPFANLRWAQTADGINYMRTASAGVGGVYIGETFTVDVDRSAGVNCTMTTSNGSGSVGGGIGALVPDHVRLVAADVQIELVAFQHN